MKSRTSARKPKAEIERILSLVRLLPADAKLADLSMEAFKLIRDDRDGLLKAIDLEYGVDSAKLEDIDWNDRSADRIAFEQERKNAFSAYQLRASSACIADCPQAFKDYIGIEDYSYEALFKAYCECFAGDHSHADLDNHIAESSDSIQSLFDIRDLKAMMKYSEAKELHERCYGLLTAIERARTTPELVLPEIYDEIDTNWNYIGARLGVTISNTLLRFRDDPFVAAFDGIDPNRLRRCDHCKRIFWVKRIPKHSPNQTFGCTPQCTSYLTTRKWRDKTTEEQRKKYKINRINKED